MRMPPKDYAETKPEQISWMAWILLTGFLLTFNVNSVHCETDACKDYQLVDMHQGRRESTYQSTTNTYICDDDLDSGTWMRFVRDDKSYQLTRTQCVRVKHCGTSAPLWLQESSPLPSVVGAEVTAKVCLNYGIAGVCCSPIGDATIRLCEDQTGDKFYIYKLPNHSDCYSGYCVDPIPGECEPNFKKGPDGKCRSALTTTTDSNKPTTFTPTTTTTSAIGVKETDAPRDDGRWSVTPETDRAKTNTDRYSNETGGGGGGKDDDPPEEESKGSGKEDQGEVGDGSQNPKDDDDNDMLLMVIVGVAGLVLITAIIAAAICFVRRKRPPVVTAVTKKDSGEARPPGNAYQTSAQPRDTGEDAYLTPVQPRDTGERTVDDGYTEIRDPDIVQGLPRPPVDDNAMAQGLPRPPVDDNATVHRLPRPPRPPVADNVIVQEGLPRPPVDDNDSYDHIEIMETGRPTGNVNMAFENEPEYLEVIA